MLKNKSWIYVSLIAMALVALALVKRSAEPDDLVFINAKVLTVDGQNRIVEAVAVEAGVITVVGSRQDVQAAIDRGAEVRDLNGHILVPGFIDAHGHFPGSGVHRIQADLNSPPIGQIENMSQLQAAMRAYAEKTPAGQWLEGFGYDDTMLGEQRHPSRAELDAISADHPLWLFHISGHLGVANTAALALAGIDKNTRDPDGGHIERDAMGEPTGLLEENATALVQGIIPAPGMIDLYKVLSAANEEYIAKGVTTAQSGLLSQAQLEGLSLVSRLGQTPLRLVAWPNLEAGNALVAGDFSAQGHDNDFFKVGAIKLFADGSIQGYTGYLTQPYHTPFKGDANYVGYPRTSLQDLNTQLLRFHRAGLQLAVHANGDAAIDNVIKAYASAQREFPREDARPIIIHAQMARDDQLEKMAELRMTPSFFGLHTYYWGDRHRSIFMGPQRAARMSPAKSALEKGLTISMHNDTPVVPMDPMRQMWSAVHRKSYLGTDMGTSERITAMQALRATTTDAAWQLFLEDHRGSIEIGKVADFAVLSAMPGSSENVEVLATYIGGIQVYAK